MTSQAKCAIHFSTGSGTLPTQLDQYAKFIDSTPSYVITEALKVLFKRDDEFKAWLGQQLNNEKVHELTGRGFKQTA
jgi:predicted transcriptional regulator